MAGRIRPELPTSERRLEALRLWNDEQPISVREIGERLGGVPKNSVCRMLWEARRQLGLAVGKTPRRWANTRDRINNWKRLNRAESALGRTRSVQPKSPNLGLPPGNGDRGFLKRAALSDASERGGSGRPPPRGVTNRRFAKSIAHAPRTWMSTTSCRSREKTRRGCMSSAASMSLGIFNTSPQSTTRPKATGGRHDRPSRTLFVLSRLASECSGGRATGRRAPKPPPSPRLHSQ